MSKSKNVSSSIAAIAGVAIAMATFCVVQAQDHSTGAAAQQAAAPTSAPSLKIDGELVKDTTLTTEELAKLPHVTVDAKDHKTGAPTKYSGVPMRTILLNAGVPLGEHRMRGKNLSYYLVAESADGYKVVFALPEFDEEFAERSIILADARDGKPIAGSEGPLRLIVPQEALQARWARMVVSIHIKRDQ